MHISRYDREAAAAAAAVPLRGAEVKLSQPGPYLHAHQTRTIVQYQVTIIWCTQSKIYSMPSIITTFDASGCLPVR
jgi:hypothetical protein